ncbi:MAG: hypothetical protein HWN67_22795 [Candidatus Helarchaeota archaeon]|nr:hypothetical protein [Candidatus Helarchaeota archaeon]
MKKHFVISIASYLNALIWMIFIFIFYLEHDMLIFTIIYFLLVFPNLICAASYTYEFSEPIDEEGFKEFMIYFILFLIPGVSVIRILMYQDFEENTMRTFGYSGLILIASIIAFVFGLPANPNLYFIDVLLDPSRNPIIFSILFIFNSAIYILFYLSETI